MTPENFCYWLQGWFELNKTIDHREGASKETLAMIDNHLKLVFNKLTPKISDKEEPKQPVNVPYQSKKSVHDILKEVSKNDPVLFNNDKLVDWNAPVKVTC